MMNRSENDDEDYTISEKTNVCEKHSQLSEIYSEDEDSEHSSLEVDDDDNHSEEYSDSNLETFHDSSSLNSIARSQTDSECLVSEEESSAEAVQSRPWLACSTPEIRLHACQRQARIYIRHNEADAAIEEYVRCLALARIVYGDQHWCLAQAHMILAESYLEFKNYVPQALDHGETAKKIILAWKKPPKSMKKRQKFLYVLLNIYLILGRVQTVLKNYELAKKYLEKCRKLSVVYVNSIGNSKKGKFLKYKIHTTDAKLAFDQQNFTEAIAKYNNALELLKSSEETRNDYMISTYQTLGQSYQKIGNYSQAEENLIAAISLSEDLNNEMTIKSELLLALTYSLVKTNSAIESAENILRNVIEKASSANNTTTSLAFQAVDMLFTILISSGRDEEAKKLLENNLPKKCRMFGQASSEVILSLRLLGSLCLTLDEPKMAAKYLKRCYERELILFGSSHPRVNNTKLALELVCKNSSVPSKYSVSSPLGTQRPRFSLP